MTEDLDLDNEFDDDDDLDGNDALAKSRRAERAARKEANRLRKENEAFQSERREMAFMRAGINADRFSDPIVSDFMTAYAGDLNPEAIRQAAEVRRILEPPAPAPEAAQHTAADGVAAGGVPEGSIDREQEAINAIRNADTTDEALRAYAAAGGRIKNPLDD